MDLASLHAAVPAAEEEDLLEEVAVEAWTRDRDAVLLGAPPPAADAEPPAPDPLSDGQVLGLVEHLLGAEVVSVELDPVQRLS